MMGRGVPPSRSAPTWAFVTAAVAALAMAQLAPAASAPGEERYVIAPAESTVSYRVGEVFLNDNNRFHVAVGTTQAVRGEFFVNRANPPSSRIGTIVVDISRLASDSSRRDSAIRSRWLESARFPNAEFTPTSIRGLPARVREGEEVPLTVVGNLRIRDVTQEAAFATRLKLDGPRLSGNATTNVKMTEFGFPPPSIFGVLRSENEVKIEVQFVARRTP